jgi:hypothetical protein
LVSDISALERAELSVKAKLIVADAKITVGCFLLAHARLDIVVQSILPFLDLPDGAPGGNSGR